MSQMFDAEQYEIAFTFCTHGRFSSSIGMFVQVVPRHYPKSGVMSTDRFPPVGFQLLRLTFRFQGRSGSKHALQPSLEPTDHWPHRAKYLGDAPHASPARVLCQTSCASEHREAAWHTCQPGLSRLAAVSRSGDGCVATFGMRSTPFGRESLQ
jgi:hypothetical protein